MTRRRKPDPAAPPVRWLSTTEVAAIVGLSRVQISRLCLAGRIPAYNPTARPGHRGRGWQNAYQIPSWAVEERQRTGHWPDPAHGLTRPETTLSDQKPGPDPKNA
ncbi:MAG: helix-turn-helix domain-containing protein [Vicinamibacterales bacterium]